MVTFGRRVLNIRDSARIVKNRSNMEKENNNLPPWATEQDIDNQFGDDNDAEIFPIDEDELETLLKDQ